MNDKSGGGTGGGTQRHREFTARTLAANVVTTLALSAGMTAIRFALEDRYELAVVFVIAAGILDGLDGAIARLLKSASRFGAELDSLSDVIAFGVAPAFLLYHWGLADLGRVGWIAALAYGVACALRLARYNARIDEPVSPKRATGYFSGVPAPAGAGLALLPMVLDFAFEAAIFRDSIWLVGYVALIAGLMVSALPTFSLKQVRVSRDKLVPVLFFVAMFAASVTVYRWGAVAVAIIVYLLSLPISAITYRRLLRRLSTRRKSEGH